MWSLTFYFYLMMCVQSDFLMASGDDRWEWWKVLLKNHNYFFLLNIYWSRVLLKLRERWLKLICFARLFWWNDLEVMTFYLDRLLFHLQKKWYNFLDKNVLFMFFRMFNFLYGQDIKKIVWNLTALIELIKIVTQNCVKVNIL